ncbi:hypothetical protein [Gluconacetobacter entanii]|nr:hypothetical protein [Gluconacetobacter entanii]MCW4580821.1 hypothetical protein [Gluconacetobacter entanii]MCW4584150.1 hypothetical protein [Gluconacetobacter entanii]
MMLYENNLFYHLADSHDAASRLSARTVAHLMSARILILPCPSAR